MSKKTKKAKYIKLDELENGGFLKGLLAIAPLAANAVVPGLGTGLSALTSMLDIGGGNDDISTDPAAKLNPNTVNLETGGTMSAVANVEGGEVIEKGNGQVAKISGASHEKGGVDVIGSPEDFVYSKRLGINGKSFAERKLGRVQEEHDMAVQLQKYLKKLEVDPSDEITLESTKRTMLGSLLRKSELEAEDKAEREVMMAAQFASQFENKGKGPEDKDEMFLGGLLGAASTGLGAAGTIVGGVAPLVTNILNRIGDKDNVNAFAGFGQDALDTNSQALSGNRAILDNNVSDINSSTAGLLESVGNSVGSSSQEGLLKLFGVNNAQGQINKANLNFGQLQTGLMQNRSQLENQQDRVVMEGEANKNLADTMDRDNFFSQLGDGLTNAGTQIQGLQRIKNDDTTAKMQVAALASRSLTSNNLSDVISALMSGDTEGFAQILHDEKVKAAAKKAADSAPKTVVR